MPPSVVAWAPGHISGYFRRITGETFRGTGSVGAGIVTSEGVIATVAESAETEIFVLSDGVENTGSPPIGYALERLDLTASIITESKLPIGSGFGLSAASLLATLTGLNELFALSMSCHEIALLAHEIEVKYSHGLGDVAAEVGGGLVCRTGPGIDTEVHRMVGLDDTIWCLCAGPIPTDGILGSAGMMDQIAGAYPGRCPVDLPDFLSLSRRFAEASGLITPVVGEVLQACDDASVPASMTMLGEGVFAIGDDAEVVLSGFGKVYPTGIAEAGPAVLEVRE